MKLLVETTGAFQLLDTATGTLIEHDRPTVIAGPLSTLVQDRIGRGQVRVITELNDAATDEEWVSYVVASDGDHVLALESFKSAFGRDVAQDGEPPATQLDQTPRRGGRKPKSE